MLDKKDVMSEKERALLRQQRQPKYMGEKDGKEQWLYCDEAVKQRQADAKEEK